jgi:hypothetical protein
MKEGYGLSNPASLKRLKNWMEKNCVDPDRLSEIDIEAGLEKDLSYDEAIELAIHKFPTMWSIDYMKQFEQKPKQIIFVKELADKMRREPTM